MASPDYLDFDLRLEHAGRSYRAEVVNSPAGEGSQTFESPFTDAELAATTLFPETVAAAREIGTRLFDAVFAGEVRERWSASLQEAARQERGLRLRLRLSAAPQLANLPWEFLHDGRAGGFLLLSNDTPLVHYLELPNRIHPLAVQPPLHALVMVCGPSDWEPLDIEREWLRLKEAVAPLEAQALLTLERLANPTLSGLQTRLRKGDFHIFHFIGHGGFESQGETGQGVLILEDDTGRGRRVTGGDLAIYLADEPTLRLVVLNCCEGARTSPTDLHAGVAQTLVSRGIPAVIAMRSSISDTAAVCFASEFYRALADSWPVDAALAEARKAIYGSGNPVEWATPVLHLRAPDGCIFQVARPADLGGSTPPRHKGSRVRYLVNAVLLLGALVLGCLWYFRHLHAELTHLAVGGSLTVAALLKFAYDCVKWGAEDELGTLAKRLLATRRSTVPLVALLGFAVVALAVTSSVQVSLDEAHRAQGKHVLTISRVADGQVVWTTPELNADHPTAGRIFLLRKGGPLRLVLDPGPGLQAWETNLPIWAVLRLDVPRDLPERKFRVLRILPGPSLLLNLPSLEGPVVKRYELELEANGQVQRLPDLRQQALLLSATREDLELAVATESPATRRARLEGWLPGLATGAGAAIRAGILARWEAEPRIVEWPAPSSATNLTVRLFRERAATTNREPVGLRVSVLDATNQLQTLLIDREP